MKIQLDTINKTIKIEEGINVKEFINKIQILLGDEYENYTLLPETITYWNNPIYIPYPTEPIYPNPLYPTYVYETIIGDNIQISNDTDSTGIFNISM